MNDYKWTENMKITSYDRLQVTRTWETGGNPYCLFVPTLVVTVAAVLDSAFQL